MKTRIKYLTKRLDIIKKKLSHMEFMAGVFSRFDYQETKKLDNEITYYNSRWLQLDHELTYLTRKGNYGKKIKA